jgi:hypothetical protein
VAFMVMNFEVDDYDTWKSMFDADPVGRSQSGATSHVVSRSVDVPNECSSASSFRRSIRLRRFVSVFSRPAPWNALGCGSRWA